MSIELIILLLIFFGVPTLIRLDVVSVEYRLFLLFGVFAALAILGFLTLSPSTMGLTGTDFMSGLAPWGIATSAMFIGILVLGTLLKHHCAEDPLHDPHFLFLFIPISIVQQFMYQSVLLQKLLQEVDPWAAIMICALCFGYMHTIFPRRLRNFVLATAGGALFSSLFYFYPNFALAILSHMILNFAAVYSGFFTLLTSEGKPRATRLRPIKKHA